ncbi:superfamily II DNA/RNA helicases, SNF2 family [Lachnospiraceae bacterium KM106-2]|nr:superfamily II DNA/RNA helicases, SNF2 family [Lachnospiraceae bacterium KM106-2]
MLTLSRDEIKKMATDDTVFNRGIRYYKAGAVSNVKWSKANQQYHATVKGSNDYNVIIDVSNPKHITHHCNCAGHTKYEGACKHVVAALLFVSDYLDRKYGKKPENKQEQVALNIIQYFERQDYGITYGEFFQVEVNISVPKLLRGNSGRALVSLKAGANRIYKIQNLRKFLMDYQTKQDIVLGKEFKFIYGESTFTKESQAIIDFLLEILDIQETIDSNTNTTLFHKNQVMLTTNLLLKLLHLIGEQSFSLELYGEVMPKVYFQKGNPEIRLGINMQEDAILIEHKMEELITPLSDKGQLMLVGNTLYEPDRKFIKNYVPFYSCFGKENAPIVFGGEIKDQFLKVVLPKINDTMTIDIPDELKDHYIEADMHPSIYLDRHKNNVRATVKFKYGEYEINPLDYMAKDGIIIVRKPDEENEILCVLDDLHFVPSRNYFALRDEKHIFEFITLGIQTLSEMCDLYYSDDFKGLMIKTPGKLTTNLKVNNEINMLEMELEYDEIPKDELQELFHSLQLKKKYHRLKNGNFISLEDDNISEMVHLFDHLNITEENVGEESITLPKNAALYLDSVFEDSSNVIVNKNEQFKDLVEGILKPGSSNFIVPEKINATLRPYQVTGYRWLKTLASHGLGGILADDMGLGKTLQTIVYIVSCLMEHPNDNQTHLIVCPTSLVYNWQDEFANFAPFVKTEVISGAPEVRKELIEGHANVDVLITSYPLIRRDSEHYEKLQIHTMFIDEAQFIKNANSISAKAVKKVNAKHRFSLTGTPIENSLSELWSIFDFIMPYYLLTHSKFVEQYEKPIVKEENSEALSDLTKHIQPFILRRMKRDVLQELPDKIETKLLTDMTEEQTKIYLSYMESIRSEINAEIKQNGFEKSQMKILAALTRLRQICCHPSTFIDGYEGGSGKLDLLMDILPDILLNGHRVLIFSQFTSMLELIAGKLKENDIDYFYLEGSTSMEERGDYVKRFNNGEKSVFLISLKAGGTGLNLTGADTVIHYDPWWNPAVEEQATDRVYRIGQKNSVHVIKLLTRGTIEEKIYKLQKKKRALSDAVIQSKEVFINKLTKEELEDIFL